MPCPIHSPVSLLNPVEECNPHRRYLLLPDPGGKVCWHSWAPQDCNKWRDSYWQANPPKALHRQQTKTQLQSFHEKGLFTYSGVSAWGKVFRFPPYLEVKEIFLGYISSEKPSLCTPLASLELDKTSQKGAYTFTWGPSLCNYHTEETFRSLCLEASRDYNYSPTALYIFAYFKSCFISLWLPINLKLFDKWDSALWNNYRSWHTLNKNQSGSLDNHNVSRDNQELEQSRMRRINT